MVNCIQLVKYLRLSSAYYSILHFLFKKSLSWFWTTYLSILKAAGVHLRAINAAGYGANGRSVTRPLFQEGQPLVSGVTWGKFANCMPKSEKKAKGSNKKDLAFLLGGKQTVDWKVEIPSFTSFLKSTNLANNRANCFPIFFYRFVNQPDQAISSYRRR